MSSKAYEVVTDRIIEKLQAGTVPWRQTWEAGQAGIGEHRSLVSGKRYRGINTLLTASQGFASPYWLTFKQALELGGSVRKGEKGTPIVFVGRVTRESESDDSKPESFSFLRYYTVFNAEQCDGIEYPKAEVTPREFSPIEAAQRIAEAMPQRPRLEHAQQRAYYSPFLDYVNMPKPETFSSPEAYYSTLFHELGHSTGHESRLKRESLQKVAGFGTHEYSKEELVAEMTAAFLCHESGIADPTIDNTASYIASWLKVLRNYSKLIVSAAAQAQKAADFILDRKPEVAHG